MILSLLDGLTIDFPSHFVLFVIDVYRNTTTRDKLIFPSAITWILHHFSVSYPKSTHFSPICAIDTAIIRRSEAQLRLKWPQTEMVTPPASSAPSTSRPSWNNLCAWMLALTLSGHREHSCWSYHLTTGCHGWFHCFFFSISTGFRG